MEKRILTGKIWALDISKPITVMYLIIKTVPGTKADLQKTTTL